MELYINEKAAWEPEDVEYVRGIPSEYEQLLEEAKSREPVEVEGDNNGLFRNLVDGNTYGLLEVRENPFEECVLEVGEYSRSDRVLLDIGYVEKEHLQDRARVVRIGEEKFRSLVEVRTRLMSDMWSAKLVDLEDLDLEDYTPSH